MVIKLEIPEEYQHPKWTGETLDIIQPAGLKFAGMNYENQWIIKLEWQSEGLKVGTGFFVNIPGASHDVILTAAHNLIDAKGERSADLIVNLPRLQDDPQNPDAPPKIVYQQYRVPETDVRIAADHSWAKPTPASDWGAILLPRGVVIEYGFGYSIRLGYEEHLHGEMHVVGYRAGAENGAPGHVDRAETEVGISGSPVWCEYQGSPTVVAIHNTRAVRKGGPRGARITLDLLREVFQWVQVGKYDVQLRAKEGPKARPTKGRTPREDPKPAAKKPIVKMPQNGLFLKFSDGWDFARVKLGSGSRFDVLPVGSVSGKNQTMWAMLSGDKWVYFNGIRNEVKLTDKLKDGCLFNENNVKLNQQTMRVVTGPSDGKQYQLKIQGRKIKEFDGDDAESSEVYLVDYPEKDDELFTRFWFE